MSLTPLTPAEVGGALGDDEIRAMHVSGPKIGMVLVYKKADPELLAAQSPGEVVVYGPGPPRLLSVSPSPVIPGQTQWIVCRVENIHRFADPLVYVNGSQAATMVDGNLIMGQVSAAWPPGEVPVEIRYENGNGFRTNAVTVQVAASAPTNTAPPTISGTPTVGETLTAANGTWTGSPTFTRQWLANDVPIAGATNTTLSLAAGHEGAQISVRVTGTNSEGSASATSTKTVAVAPAA